MPLSLLSSVSLSLRLCPPVYRFPPRLTPDETLIPPGVQLYPGEHTLSSVLSSKDSEIDGELTHGCGAGERRGGEKARRRRRRREGGLELKL